MDEFETANALGDRRNGYKYMGVYYRIGNLAERYQSVDYFNQLAILYRARDLKKIGFDKFFECLLVDLAKLEKTGIEVDWRLGNQNGTINLKDTICFILADSLAANAISGLLEKRVLVLEKIQLVIYLKI